MIRPIRFSVFVLGALLCLLTAASAANAAPPYPDDDWPLWTADWGIEIVKDPNAVPPPHEPSDLAWLHLHRNHPQLADATVNTIKPRLVRGYDEMSVYTPSIEMQYVVRGVPVSDWLSAPFVFELDIDNPAFAEMADGVHDLTVLVRGPDRADFQPVPAFIHLTRERAQGDPFGYDNSVPIMNIVQGNPGANDDWSFGPGIVYVDPSERNHVGYPVNPDGTPWSTPPNETDLYQEVMGPHTEEFGALQMWWDHPGESGKPFVRGMTPQHGEDHRNLRVTDGHERFPMKDGPAGVGWMSPYVAGTIDSQGRFAFAEAGGRVGYVMPDGEIITLAGLRVQPGKDPLWWEKTTEVVHGNMEIRGNWLAGRGEFFTPLDVAIDSQDENILYVAAYEDHVIWKIEVPNDPRTGVSTVSILAGSPNHTPGYRDGFGDAARFNGVSSLVFDPVTESLYVADQDNDAIRRVERNGRVTTVAGQPGMRQRLENSNVLWTDQLAARAATQFEVSAGQARNGVTPDIYLPQSIRVDSQGNIILIEVGYGAIRRIDPTTGETETLDEVRQNHREWYRGWAWLDVDRWGNSGPVDGIYWTKFASTRDNERFNEVYRWLPPDGGESFSLFPRGTGLYPDGWGRINQTNPPHYGWLVAVDPRGGVLLGGGGEHGLTRLRLKRAEDPVETENYWLGRRIWASGVPNGAALASQSLALKFGWAGHNMLGLTDAWALDGASDAELLDAFEVPDSIRNDAQARAHLLEFIRPNTFRSGESGPVQPVVQAPFDGANAVPGSVQAEHFDVGGQGVAYSDTESGNQGSSSYRSSESVDIWNTYGESGYTVGRTRDGEWLEFTVTSPQARSLDISARVASGLAAPGSLNVRVDGVDIGTTAVSGTGGWWAFDDVELGTHTFSAGESVVRLTWLGSLPKINLDRLDFAPANVSPGGQTPYNGPNAIPGTVQAEDFDSGGQGVAYSDTEPGNQGTSSYRPSESVDIWDTYGQPGYTVGRTRDGEWLEFTVTSPQAQSMEILAYVASGLTAPGSLTVTVDGDPVGTTAVSGTGGWWAFTHIGLGTHAFDAGDSVVRLTWQGTLPKINLDHLDFVAVGQ